MLPWLAGRNAVNIKAVDPRLRRVKKLDQAARQAQQNAAEFFWDF
jgi:hypothetical protein